MLLAHVASASATAHIASHASAGFRAAVHVIIIFHTALIAGIVHAALIASHVALIASGSLVSHVTHVALIAHTGLTAAALIVWFHNWFFV